MKTRDLFTTEMQLAAMETLEPRLLLSAVAAGSVQTDLLTGGAEQAVVVQADAKPQAAATQSTEQTALTAGTLALGGALQITSPAVPEAVYVGDFYRVRWIGGDLDTFVQLWAYGPEGWQLLADNLPASDGGFTWDTLDQPHGWYAFGAWVDDGGVWYNAASPDWLHVVDPYNHAPFVEITNPAVAQEVEQGDIFPIRWDAYDADGDTLNVSLWAYSERTGWFQVPGAEWVDARTGGFDWDTSTVPTGWYAFSAWAYDGSETSVVGSPDWVHVALPSYLVPSMTFLTPRYGDWVYQGDVFTVQWDLYNPAGLDLAVDLWGYSDATGWFHVATDINADDGYVHVDTTYMNPGWYSFAAWLGDGDLWVSAASDNWLEVV